MAGQPSPVSTSAHPAQDFQEPTAFLTRTTPPDLQTCGLQVPFHNPGSFLLTSNGNVEQRNNKLEKSQWEATPTGSHSSLELCLLWRRMKGTDTQHVWESH